MMKCSLSQECIAHVHAVQASLFEPQARLSCATSSGLQPRPSRPGEGKKLWLGADHRRGSHSGGYLVVGGALGRLGLRTQYHSYLGLSCSCSSAICFGCRETEPRFRICKRQGCNNQLEEVVDHSATYCSFVCVVTKTAQH